MIIPPPNGVGSMLEIEHDVIQEEEELADEEDDGSPLDLQRQETGQVEETQAVGEEEK